MSDQTFGKAAREYWDELERQDSGKMERSMSSNFEGSVVAAEFVPDGDPWRDDKSDAPRPRGTYLTIMLDNSDQAVVNGRVRVEYLPSEKDE